MQTYYFWRWKKKFRIISWYIPIQWSTCEQTHSEQNREQTTHSVIGQHISRDMWKT